MEILSFVIFIGTVLTFAAFPTKVSSDSSCSDSPASSEINDKLKLTSIKLLKVNEEYITNGKFKAEVVKVNETYNRLSVNYGFAKDLSLNTLYSVQVYRSKSGHDSYEELKNYNLYFCKDFCDKYFKYLPDAVIEIVKKGNCLPKSSAYQMDDQRYFKFFDLLSKDQLENSRFKMTTSLIYGKEVILSFDLYFVSQMCKKC